MKYVICILLLSSALVNARKQEIIRTDIKTVKTTESQKLAKKLASDNPPVVANVNNPPFAPFRRTTASVQDLGERRYRY